MEIENIEKKANVAKSFLQKITDCFGVKSEIETKVEDGKIFVNVIGRNLGQLIGKNGHIIEALQLLTETAVNRGDRPKIPVVLDVSNYLKRKEQKIVEDAKEIANRVRYTKKPITLPPMSAKERRAVHMALKDQIDIKVESVGTAEDRKIVISPL